MGMTSLTSTLYTPSHGSSFSLFFPEPSNCRFSSSLLYCNRNCLTSSQWRFKRKCVRISGSSSTLKDCGDGDATHNSNTAIWADSECVEVIGIGNRVDPVLDFCLRSPSHVQSLRFWNIIRSESSRGLLQQKSPGKDVHPNIVEAPLNEESYLKAVVLVASAGYGDDYVMATEILRAIRSGGGLAVAVIMKPFSFEGQRRQDEGTADCIFKWSMYQYCC